MNFLRFTFIDLIDIFLVALIIFLLFRWTKGSSTIYIIVAVLLVLFIQIFATALGLKMISMIFGVIIDVGVIGLIVLFQPEIRRLLSSLGRRAEGSFVTQKWIAKLFNNKSLYSLSKESVTEISEACIEMAEQKTGALIVLLNNNLLEDIIETGDIVDAKINRRLIMNIFFKNSPLHDGAMIIGNNRILAARCTLPISDRTDLPPRYGMRHKAAVGLSEISDAKIIVVSEQTGKISLINSTGIQAVNRNINELKLLLGEQKQDETSLTGE